MRSIAIFLTLFAAVNSFALDLQRGQSALGSAYITLEDGQVVTVFNKPGKNWKNCSKDSACEPIGWPDNGATIKIISEPQKMKVEDPYTGRMEDEEYVYVEYDYVKVMESGSPLVQSGQGWMDAAYLSKTPTKSFFGNDVTSSSAASPPPVAKEKCIDNAKSGNQAKEIEKSLAPLAKAIENAAVKETAVSIKSQVGACVIDPKHPPKKFAPGNSFDNYVLPKVNSQAVPKVTKEDGSQMTKQDLATIDALSRTMYGEMARCYKHGLQYPMTVAKIASNRAENDDRHSEFIKGAHSSQKSDLAKVVTTPSQFNVWMTKVNNKPNNTLIQALCPPSDKSKPFWTGNPPSKNEQDIWDNSVRIATEAVLYPKRFGDRTKSVKEYHYTSGMGKFFNMKQVFPWIGGRSISKDSCLEVWKEKS